MKINKNSGGGDFQPHPATTTPVRGVIVDVTDPEKKQTAFGEKEKFRVVIESEVAKNDGERFCVWSQGFTPSLNEKASFRKFLKQVFAEDVAETRADDKGDLDVEALLIGHPVQMMIVHEESDGKTYANISVIFPDKTAKPLEPSGKYVRKKDRPARDGNAASYRKTGGSGDAASARQSWQAVKVHVGRCAGTQLGDLDQEAVQKLIENWLPQFAANPKPSADDKRLGAALKEAESLLLLATGETVDF